ncbi:MAG: PQQ-dependent sugar dehydrogenase [Bacteroidota bacterium]
MYKFLPSFFAHPLGKCLIGLFISSIVIGANFFLPIASGINQATPVGPYVNGAFPTISPSEGNGDWQVSEAFTNISFSRPIFLAEEPQTGRLFVGEHVGRIYSFPNERETTDKRLVLDIRNATWFSGESGLLSFAFHPRYGIDSNYLYVFYQYDGNLNYSRLSRFTISLTTGQAVPNSEQVLIQLYDRASNHNAGMIFFGLDGYLYISTGDEGGGNNAYDNSQSLTDRHLGGVLRIDVDRDPTRSHPIRRQPALLRNDDNSFTANYFIPNDNPWLDGNGAYLEEFYALGLRNPHRMSQDPVTGEIWLADVGQGKREEVDLIVKGGNYQWGYREGFLNGPQSQPSPLIGTDEAPIHDYDRNDGKSVTGGYVYRGNRLPSLQGAYLFGDYASRRLWALRRNPDNTYSREQLMTLPFALSSFGVDNAGELYLLNFGGGTIEILSRQSGSTPDIPNLLSETGVFESLSPLVPRGFCTPYDLNVPFWSDGAEKKRWLILPNDGQHNSPGEQIEFSESGDWQFPTGTVLVKHFELSLDSQNPTQTRKIETRFIVFGENNSFYGVTYRWNEAQTDATLLLEGRRDTFALQTPQGSRFLAWSYPSPAECLTCHNTATGGALGLQTSQLNGTFQYPSTNRTANQLTTFAHLNMLSPSPDTNALNQLPIAAPSTNTSFSLEERARAYLDINCASCHRSGNTIQARFDTRMEESQGSPGLFYGDVIKDLGIPGAKVIIPGSPDKSLLYLRMKSVHEEISMPQIGKNEVDSIGIELIGNWIQSLPPSVSYQGKMGQTLTFPPITDRGMLDPSFSLTASTSSGLTPTYEVVSGPAALSGNQLSLTGSAGEVRIRARQQGNGTYHPAPEAVQSFWVLPDGKGQGSGLTGRYFTSPSLQNEVFRRTDPQVDFNWNSSSPSPIQMGYDGFSVSWEGEIEVPYGETYTFITTTDDGVRLWVNEQLVIDSWEASGPEENSGQISLNAWDRVPIRMEFFEESVYAAAQLQWSSTSIAPQVVPTRFLYPLPTSTPEIYLWLEGYFNSNTGSMVNELQASDLLPMQQPYNFPPFNYEGGENVSSMSAYVIDWVLVELRSPTPPYTLAARQAVLIDPSGMLLNTSFDSRLIFPGLTSGSYRVAIFPKSHLPIMSAQPLTYSSSEGLSSYDFRIPSAVSGSGQLKQIGNHYVLYAGDYDFNGIINNLDFNQWKQNSAAINQYLSIDADGNGIVNNLDFNIWKSNGSKIAVPEVQN